MRALSAATIFSAASGFLILLLAARALDPASAAEFQAYWAVFFAFTGFLDGLLQETTRSVSAAENRRPKQISRDDPGRRAPLRGLPRARRHPHPRNQPHTQDEGWDDAHEHPRSYGHPGFRGQAPPPPGQARPWGSALTIGLGLAFAVTLTSPLWLPRILGDHQLSGSLLLGLGLLSYAFQATVGGVLSGRQLWGRYAGLLALDSGIRIALTVVAWALGLGLPVFLIVTVIGAASWLLFVRGLSPRSALDVSTRIFRRRVLSTMLATGSSALMTTGIAALIAANFSPGAHRTVTLTGIIMAVTLTRAPILVPLQRFQSALIVRFVTHRDRVPRMLIVPLAATLGVGALGALGAWLIGPWILEILLPPEYSVPGPLLAALTFASSLTGCLMITGAATIGVEKHRWYPAGWLASAGVAFLILSAPLEIEAAVVGALIAGPLVGIAIHVMGVLRGEGIRVESPARAGEEPSPPHRRPGPPQPKDPAGGRHRLSGGGVSVAQTIATCGARPRGGAYRGRHRLEADSE